jgi:nitroreductase
MNLMISELIKKNRSYRRFFQDFAIDRATLLELVDCARLSASARNAQPLKYYLSSDSQKNDLIFPTLAWAGYLKEWIGPQEGEKPSAYIVMLGDTDISLSFGSDQGIAAQSILLAATEKGLGGCMIGSIQREILGKNLNIPERYQILLVIALGKPKEQVVLEPLPLSGDIKYWRDDQEFHHVPKRSIEEILIN